MNEPLVSIIILNYNGLQYLKECFESLQNIVYKNTELILVDNNSQDNSVKFINKNFKDVKIIELKTNYGFSKGNNIGLTYANGEYIMLLNADTIVDRNWLSELVKVAEKSKKVGIVGSKIYYYDKRTIIDFAGSSNDKYGNTHQIGADKPDNDLVNKLRKSFYICGASILFKRELVEKLDLFDPVYFAYYEDVDFCWRAWICGYDILYVPKSFIYHKIGPTIKDFKRKRYLFERNRLRTILKNYELKSLRRILPRFFYQWIISLNSKFHKDKSLYYTYRTIYFKSVLWNLFHILSLIQKRRSVQSHRIRSDEFLFQLMDELQKFAKVVSN